MSKNSELVKEMISSIKAYDSDVLYIYHLILDGAVVYVGQTSFLKKRLQNHIQFKEFNSISVKQCNRVDANEIEAIDILTYMPIHNKSLPKNSGFMMVGSVKNKLSEEVLNIINSFEHVEVKNFAGGYRYVPTSVYTQLSNYLKNFKYQLKAEVK